MSPGLFCIQLMCILNMLHDMMKDDLSNDRNELITFLKKIIKEYATQQKGLLTPSLPLSCTDTR